MTKAERKDVEAEVAAAFASYEEALRQGDGAALDALFWHDPRIVRFGADEELWDRTALERFNAARRRIPDRALGMTRIVALGGDHAVVATTFHEVGPERVGRQMQTWARVDGAWRVVAAHVSVRDSEVL